MTPLGPGVAKSHAKGACLNAVRELKPETVKPRPGLKFGQRRGPDEDDS
jgi:hypothetical protein